MEVKEFRCIVDILSPTSAKTTIFSHFDLNMPLPQSLLNFLLKHLAGIVLYKFQQKAASVRNDSDSTHAHRIREDKDFYQDWVLPRLRFYCDVKGWAQPEIPSLQHTDGAKMPATLDEEADVSKSQEDVSLVTENAI